MILHNGFANSTIICNEKKEVDLDALNLLASGEIQELCLCKYKSEKGHHHFIYDTDSLIPFTKIQDDLSFDNVIGVLSSALMMVKFIGNNNLSLDNIKNSKEYIFKTNDNFKFIYIPVSCKQRLRVKDYFLKLIAIIHIKDNRIAHMVKEIKKLKEDEKVIAYLTDFVASFDYYKNYSEQDTSLLSDEGATTLLSSEEETTVLNGLNTNNNTDFSKEASFDFDEGETTVLSQTQRDENAVSAETESNFNKVTAYIQDESSECETTVLTSQPNFSQPVSLIAPDYKISLFLIRNMTGERISVDITPFTIGKDIANMDYVLDNESVSRHHATIVYEDNGYFIMDNKSTNGTIIEGIKLQPYEKAELDNGYILSLGNESFQTQIERR